MLNDKIALVTGATRGIGRAIALELGRQGATVIGTATSEEGAGTISAYLAEAGIKDIFIANEIIGTDKLEKIRKKEKAFMTNADTWTVETWDNSILCIGRYYDGDKIYGLFNFSEYDKTAWINERDGLYKDLITGQEMEAAGVNIPAYGFYWLKKK